MVANPKELVGQTVGGYRLEHILGTGATGAVFLGRNANQPDTPVAIKLLLLPWQTSDAERQAFQERFRREAQALLSLNYPNIPRLIGFGEEQDYNYLVLQYIDNGSLFTRLQQGQLPYDEIVRYTQQLGGAIDFAHNHDLVHRDIKPANVLLDKQGNAYLSDFSIVRLFTTDKRTNLTSTGQAIGTPEYMSPEQMRGEEAGKTSDIYSFGLLVYQMVTGKVPFEGTSIFDLAKKHNETQPPSPRFIRPDLPMAAEAAIYKALAKDPNQRFANATAFATAFTTGMQTPNPTVPAPQTMSAGPTGGQYIPPTGATQTPFPQPPVSAPSVPQPGSSAAWPAISLPQPQPSFTQQPTQVAQPSYASQPTYVSQPGFAPPPTQPPMQSPQPEHRSNRSTTPILIGVIVVLLIALIAGGAWAFVKLNSLGGIGAVSATATIGTSGSSANAGTATATATANQSIFPTATIPLTTGNGTSYSAAQPGPGCDSNGGTWTPKDIDQINCGTDLYIYPTQTYGFLYLQLPSGEVISPSNVISVTGNPQHTMCLGLAETDANTGYMVDYCGDGTWNIYSISSAGSIIHTIQKSVTSTRTTTNLSMTLKGTTLSFSIDTETHGADSITPIVPTKMAIVYFDSDYSGTCCFNWHITVSNFGYTPLSA